ncbi:MAG: hypothetical protein IPK66_11920 [Rhodospirillales bacterium]|nr:hypothetical protein [Rhodospirillales bacterium]
MRSGDVWWVYQDVASPLNHGSWTNVVPANTGARLQIDLADPGAPRGTAIRLAITFAPGHWAGIAVASAPNYWGATPGEGFDLAGARTLVFSARGAAGGERVRIKAGVAGDQPFGDSASLPIDSGWLTLSADWREYRIATDGHDLSRVITPFMLIANDKHNPAGHLSIFLDDIRYEAAP